MSPTRSRKSPYTQWRRIVGWKPHPGAIRPRALVLETLECGHVGKRSELARVEQRIGEGQRRLCKPCTDQVRTERVAAHAQAICRMKVPYVSQTSAQAAARRLGGRGYRCKACGAWHLTTGGN
jgi:hypothetical protein